MTSKDLVSERLRSELDRAAAVRARLGTDKEALARRDVLRKWQADRLSRTYADLLAHPRYNATAKFFLTDLYGPQDLTQHEEAVRRLLPTMEKLLPEAGLQTVADAIELNALSEMLDAAVNEALRLAGIKTIDATSYAKAYASVGRRSERQRQIELIGALGHSLDALTHHPLIGTTLSMMRLPAKLAGMGNLQSFLERGYSAFRGMNGAEEFLAIVETRELALLERLIVGESAELERLMRDGG